jgi:hypothetical protein
LRACTNFSIATQHKQHFHKSAHRQSDAQAQRSVTSGEVSASSSEAAMTPAKLRAQAKELQFLQRKAQEVRASPFNFAYDSTIVFQYQLKDLIRKF